MLVVFVSMIEEESSGVSAPLVSEDGTCLVNLGCGIRSLLFGEDPSSSATVYVWFNLLGDCTGVNPRPGELPVVPGVLGRICVGGEFGVDGRRKGEARGDPKDKGDGRKGVFETCNITLGQPDMILAISCCDEGKQHTMV